MPRGGQRQGRPGASYGNRTDLNVVKLPATAAPGQVYGQAAQQVAAQQQMPMGAQPTPAPAAPSAAGGEPRPPALTPGSLGPLTAPTNRPNEPLTAGAPFGPGPGPVAPQQSVPTTGASTLTSLAASGNPALAYLASVAGSRL